MGNSQMTRLKRPTMYFREYPLDESRVLRFWYDEEAREVELVVVYAHEFLEELFGAGSRNQEWLLEPDPQHPDCLQRFVFVDVGDLARHEVAVFYRGDIARHYHAASHAGTTVIETVDVRASGSRFEMDVFMGSFGVAHFKFTEVYKEQKFGVLQQVGTKEWEYRDVTTGEAFSDEDPFASHTQTRDEV